MKRIYFILPLLCLGLAATAQEHKQSNKQEQGSKQEQSSKRGGSDKQDDKHEHHQHGRHEHPTDSTDVFFRHLQLNEVVVTTPTGDAKMKHATAPVTLVSAGELRQTAATNIIDAIARQPGMAQVTTGGGISKPIIRGLGYNRVVVMSDGVRQEGQQWGDEHGIEVDAQAVHSVEILKGPASLMYGSDAMAGVVILRPAPLPIEGEMRASVATEYQTNNGLFDYSLNMAGNHQGFVWDGRYSDKMAHAYKNSRDGYVPGTQFAERAGRLLLGLNKRWGHSHLTATLLHQTPSIAEGERDEVTGELECTTRSVKTYSRALPFQQVRHYKVVSDNLAYVGGGVLKAVVGYQQNRRQEFEESQDEYDLYFRLHTATYDLRYQLRDLGGWKTAVGLGGMWQQSQNLGEETLIPAYRLFDIGGYATASRSFDHWTVNGGLRYDHRHLTWDSNPSFFGLTGSLGAVWNASEHLNLRLNLARGFRAPNMSELGSDGVHEGTLRYEIGNPQLKPEYSWQADLGLDFTSKYVSAQLALFANRIEHYIFAHRVASPLSSSNSLYLPLSPSYLTYAFTQGDARLLGFEADIDLHPTHALHFQNTFSLVDARLLHADADTRYLPQTPPARWTSEVKYEFTHHGHATLDNAYVALRLDCNLAQHHYYRADQTETRTPAYTLLGLSAGTDINIRHRRVASLHVVADNLLDRAYQSHLSRLKYADVNPLTGRRGICNMGRNVVLKLVVPLTFRIASAGRNRQRPS